MTNTEKPDEALDGIHIQRLINQLDGLVRLESWDVIDFILNSIRCEAAEGGTLKGFMQGMVVGVHVSRLRELPAMRERASFKDLVARYKTALEASPAIKEHGLDPQNIIKQLLDDPARDGARMAMSNRGVPS